MLNKRQYKVLKRLHKNIPKVNYLNMLAFFNQVEIHTLREMLIEGNVYYKDEATLCFGEKGLVALKDYRNERNRFIFKQIINFASGVAIGVAVGVFLALFGANITQ